MTHRMRCNANLMSFFLQIEMFQFFVHHDAKSTSEQHADNIVKLCYNALLVCIQVCCVVMYLLFCCWKLLGCVATRLVCHGPKEPNTP